MANAERAPVIADPGCAMCADIYLEANPFSFLVAELNRSNVRLARNQFRRGWTIVAHRRHATELFELAPDELAEFWQEVARVARALFTIYRPANIITRCWVTESHTSTAIWSFFFRTTILNRA